jgi:hypothetical protein
MAESFKKKASIAANNITLGVPGRRADKKGHREKLANKINRKAGGQGEFSVGLAARRDVVSQPAT